MRKLDAKEAKRLFFMTDIMRFKDYINFMEEFLEAEKTQQEENLEKINAEADPDALIVLDRRIWYAQTGEFSGLLRKSFFVSIFSFFENRLIGECRSRRNNKIPLIFDDIYAHDELQKVAKYFTKVLQIDFPNNTPQWDAIQNYRIIRNCIVHAQGKLNELKNLDDQQKLLKYLKKNANVVLVKEEIYLKKGFCEEALQDIETFLHLVLFPNKSKQ